MERTLILDTSGEIGKKVRILGWIDSIRDHGKITFIDLRDRSGIVQCVGKDLPKCLPESVVEIIGEVSARPEKLVNPNIETGKIEIQIKEMNVISASSEQASLAANRLLEHLSEQKISDDILNDVVRHFETLSDCERIEYVAALTRPRNNSQSQETVQASAVDQKNKRRAQGLSSTPPLQLRLYHGRRKMSSGNYEVAKGG